MGLSTSVGINYSHLGSLTWMLGSADGNAEATSWFAGCHHKFASSVAHLTNNNAGGPVRKFFVERVEKATDN